MTQPLPPPGWFPDPASPDHVRYWDGAQWTEHVADAVPAPPQSGSHVEPQPQTEPAPQSEALPDPQLQPALQPEPQPTNPYARPSGPKAWNGFSTLILLVCIALVLTAFVGVNVWKDRAGKALAGDALTSFLDAAVVGDESWRDFANDSLVSGALIGTPLRGAESVAQELELEVSYSAGDLVFYSEKGEKRGTIESYDAAFAPVTFTYSFLAGGERVESVAQLNVWLTRPFYYDDREAKRADLDKTPSSIGPWRVTSFTAPEDDDGNFEVTDFSTTFTQTYSHENDGNVCFAPDEVFGELYDSARIDNVIRSSCIVEGVERIPHSENLEQAAMVSALPVASSMSNIALPPELVFPGLNLEPSSSSPFPLAQYYFRSEDGVFVVVLASANLTASSDADTGEPDTGFRVVYFAELEEQP